MIQNPTPVTAGTFNGYWIANVQIVTEPKVVQATLHPYDGTHLLATGRKIVNTKTGTDELVAAVAAEAQRLAGKTEAVRVVRVGAVDPAKPVTLTIIFNDNSVFTVRDCFAKAGEDAVFGAAFSAALAGIAALAGLEVA